MEEAETEEEVRFLAFLAKVSTKLDLIERATADSVAWRRLPRSFKEGVPVRGVEEEERSALRCSIVVVVVFFEGAHFFYLWLSVFVGRS